MADQRARSGFGRCTQHCLHVVAVARRHAQPGDVHEDRVANARDRGGKGCRHAGKRRREVLRDRGLGRANVVPRASLTPLRSCWRAPPQSSARSRRRCTCRIACGVIGMTVSASPLNVSRSVARCEQLVDFLVQLPRDGLGQVGRPDDAVPGQAVETFVAGLLERRHVRQERLAAVAGDGERLERARTQVRHRGCEARKNHLDLSAHGVGKRLADAPIGHGHAGHARCMLELLHHQVVQRANTRRAVVDLARIGLGVGDEFLQRVHRHRARHDQYVGSAAEHCDGREILDGVVAEIAFHGRIRGVRCHVADHQRVAVRLRAGGHLRRDRAARAGLVLDHEGLAHRQAQLVGDDARDQVHAAARRLRRDDLHRPIRIGVLRDGRRSDRDDRDGRKQAQPSEQAAQFVFHGPGYPSAVAVTRPHDQPVAEGSVGS